MNDPHLEEKLNHEPDSSVFVNESQLPAINQLMYSTLFYLNRVQKCIKLVGSTLNILLKGFQLFQLLKT